MHRKGAVEIISKVLLHGGGGKNLSSLLNAWDCVKKINAVMPVAASGNGFPLYPSDTE